MSSSKRPNIVDDVGSSSSLSEFLDQKEDKGKKSSNFGIAEIIGDEEESDSGS